MSDNQKLLDEALARGVITSEQRAEMDALQANTRVDGDERIRVVSNLNEIFVAVGTLMFVNAATGFLAIFIKNNLLVAIVSIAIATATALFFNSGKRFRLPIICCVLSAAISMGLMLNELLAPSDVIGISDTVGRFVLPIVAAMVVLGTGAAYFRIPFLMAPIGILFAIAITTTAKLLPDAPLQLLLGAVGLSILMVALYFDLKDPRRVSRWSDFAFWSYAVGSPLFVHSLFLGILIGTSDHVREVLKAGIIWPLMAALALAITFAGLLLNRRALILSTLIYVGIILFRMITFLTVGTDVKHDTDSATVLSVTMIILGLYVILLGSRWPRIRRRVISNLPRWRWLEKLPPY